MTATFRKKDLSSPRRQLLTLMQQLNFGRIENLVVLNGEPQFDPPPHVVREIKFGGDNEPRREVGSDDFLLKAQAVELFDRFDRLRSFHIDLLEVKHGLPFRMSVPESSC